MQSMMIKMTRKLPTRHCLGRWVHFGWRYALHKTSWFQHGYHPFAMPVLLGQMRLNTNTRQGSMPSHHQSSSLPAWMPLHAGASERCAVSKEAVHSQAGRQHWWRHCSGADYWYRLAGPVKARSACTRYVREQSLPAEAFSEGPHNCKSALCLHDGAGTCGGGPQGSDEGTESTECSLLVRRRRASWP